MNKKLTLNYFDNEHATNHINADAEWLYHSGFLHLQLAKILTTNYGIK